MILKVPLTKEIMMRECRDYHARIITDNSILALLNISAEALCFYIFIVKAGDFWRSYIVGFIGILIIFTGLWIFLYINIGSIVMSAKVVQSISKGRVSVVTDTVTGRQTRTYRRYGRSQPYTLEFENSGKYCIPPRKSYKWSVTHAASDEDIFDDSFKGDTFYLLICRDRIEYAFNSKWFELEEDTDYVR